MSSYFYESGNVIITKNYRTDTIGASAAFLFQIYFNLII